MDLSKVAVFRMTTGKMSWLTERQRVLSQNIANSDTPKYKPQDMKEVDFRKLVKRNTRSVTLYRTHKSHMSLGNERFKFDTEHSKGYETAPSGNAVILEQQLIKNAETVADYQLMTNLYRKHISMFKMALGGGKGQ